MTPIRIVHDNSRFIHTWRIETFVSAKTRLETLQEAIKNGFGDKAIHQLQFVSDSGPENDNLTVKEFMDQNSIHHTIALRDIVQSNSMMEAFYRTTKYQCLYQKKIENGNQLLKEFENWIREYNYQNPHHALGIYTPFEVLNGEHKNQSFKERMIDTAQKRREFNKKANCKAKCKE